MNYFHSITQFFKNVSKLKIHIKINDTVIICNTILITQFVMKK